MQQKRNYDNDTRLTCVIEEALIVDVDLTQRPFAEPICLGQDSLLEIVDKVTRPNPFEFFLEFIDHVPTRLRHQQIFYASLYKM